MFSTKARTTILLLLKSTYEIFEYLRESVYRTLNANLMLQSDD